MQYENNPTDGFRDIVRETKHGRTTGRPSGRTAGHAADNSRLRGRGIKR